MTQLHTARLHLRPCQEDDLDPLHSLWREPDVRRYLFDDRLCSREEAEAFIIASMAAFRDHGYGLWVFSEQAGSGIAGFSGLFHSSGPPSLVFGTRPQHWGRGFATEASRGVLSYAFVVLGLKSVVADVDEPNAASIRVLEALGMSRVGRSIVNGQPLLNYQADHP